MLTPKQSKLLKFIESYKAQKGVVPTVAEMREYMKIKSTSGVHSYLTSLEKRGFISRMPHMARAIEVLKRADSVKATAPTNPSPKMGLELKRGVHIPYFERIAAGSPTANWAEPDKLMEVPPQMTRGHSCFALKVSGDSMQGAGILDGDIVIMRNTSEARNGDIVAGLVDGEVTLKTIRFDNKTITLEPANPNYKPMKYAIGEVQVQGVLVNLIRNYSAPTRH